MHPVLIAFAVVLSIALVVLWVRLRQHRIDLKPGESAYAGASEIWQRNVYKAANYDNRGRELLPWLIAVQTAWTLISAGLLFSFVFD